LVTSMMSYPSWLSSGLWHSIIFGHRVQ
jgi:hypothetical protein